MSDYFTKSQPFQITTVGDWLKPVIERARECACPVYIKVRFSNMNVPFPCGHCTVCKSLKKRR